MTSTSTLSSRPANCYFTSLARLKERTCIKFSVHHCELYSNSFQLLKTLSKVKWSPPGRKNVFLALSACIFLSLGRKNTAFPTESIAHIVIIWSIHLKCYDLMSIFASIGSRGNSAILRPRRVSYPLSFKAPRAYRSSRPRTSISCGGGSRKSKSTKLSIPMLLSIRMTLPILLRWI